MGLKVNTNVEALNVHRSLLATNLKVGESLKRLSSGFRVNSAKDDASGFAIANMFRARISGMRVASQNASEAQAYLQTADGAYSKIQDILIRMKDLATQAASGQSESNLETMNKEFLALQNEIDRIATSTKYGNTTLIDGSLSTNGITFQVGALNAADNQLNLKLTGASTSALAVSSSAINLNTAADAQTSMSAIETALTSINYFMGEVGTYQNRLQYTMENLSITIENFSASESTIRDVDMAYEVVNFTKNQILQQTSMAMLAQANAAPQQILTLLQ